MMNAFSFFENPSYRVFFKILLAEKKIGEKKGQYHVYVA